jgi:hypothetical protein
MSHTPPIASMGLVLAVRIQATTLSLDAFAAQYCRYFGAEIVFLPTEGVQPPGREVRFVFELADGRALIRGRGVVVRMRRDSGNPLRPPGMELRYELDDEASRRLVEHLIELRTRGAGERPDPPPYVSMRLTTDEQQPALVVPANPLGGIPETVLALFAEWGIEAIRARPRSRWATFASGMAVGAAAMVLGGAVASWTPSHSHTPAYAALPARLGVGSGGAAPTPAPPPPARLAPPSPPPPMLLVRSRPSGATVRVDGARAGVTPLELAIGAGPHHVVVEHARYQPAQLDADAPGRVLAELERPRALLRVVSSPPGAEVAIDGRAAGTTPFAVETTGYEHHAITVQRGAALKKRRVYLRPPITEAAFDLR